MPLQRTTSSNSTKRIIPSNYFISSSTVTDPKNSLIPHKGSKFAYTRLWIQTGSVSTILKSIINFISIPLILPTCKWLTLPSQLSITPTLGRKVNGTLFGNRRGLVTFAVQVETRSEPVLLIELAITTSALVKEMSSGLVRIALECEKPPAVNGRKTRLLKEPMWTMYCNGRNYGYALSRACNESDWHVLSTVQSVSVGAGVIPVVDEGGKVGSTEGELLYMRARFERVVGGRDSEAFYMLNPEGNNGGPELSIFLLRI